MFGLREPTLWLDGASVAKLIKNVQNGANSHNNFSAPNHQWVTGINCCDFGYKSVC